MLLALYVALHCSASGMRTQMEIYAACLALLSCVTAEQATKRALQCTGHAGSLAGL